MIGAAFGVSPAARPYFNHGGVVVTPLAPYTSQGLGTNHAFNAGGIATLSLPNVGIAAGEEILIAVTTNNQLNVDHLHVSFAGLTLCGGVAWVYNGANYALWTYYAQAVGVQAYGTVLADFTFSTGEPTVAAMLATRVSTLTAGACPVPIDVTKGNFGTSGTQDSGLGVATAQAHEFLWGLIATSGRPTDTLGAWAGPLVAAQRVGDSLGVLNTSTIDLKEGGVVINAISTYRSEVTGATSRAYRSLLQTFKAI